MCGNRECVGQFLTIIIVIGLGAACGLLLEPNSKFQYPYNYGSGIIGWTYFFAWSISFYPQLIHNFKRKTTSGLSVDFLLFNAVGFLCYSVFNVTMYFIPEFRYGYERRHHGNAIQISLNDVCFSLHALLLTLITWAQVIYYDGHLQIPSPSAFLSGFLFLVICSVYVLFITQSFHSNRDPWNWYYFIYFIAFSKLVVTFIKYPPQILTNRRLKSTVGFNITQILLDLLGSLLSLLQLLLDCYFSEGNFKNLLGNPVKLFLSFIVLFYDSILIYQHYGAYASSRMSLPPSDMNNSFHSFSQLRINNGTEPTYYTSIQNNIENENDNEEDIMMTTRTTASFHSVDSVRSNTSNNRKQITATNTTANWNSNKPASASNGSGNIFERFHVMVPKKQNASIHVSYDDI